MQRQLDVIDRLPQLLPIRVPHRLHVPGAGQFEAAQPHLGDPVNLGDRLVDIAVGQAGETDLPVGVVTAEILQPVIVDAQHLVAGFGVVELRCGAENAVDDLGVDPVLLHVLEAQMRVVAAGLALLGVGIETVLGHDVDADVLSRDMLRAAGADAVEQPEIGAVLGDPLRPVRPVLDIGHALLEVAPGVLDEQSRRHPGHVEMAIGRDALVMHGASFGLECAWESISRLARVLPMRGLQRLHAGRRRTA